MSKLLELVKCDVCVVQQVMEIHQSTVILLLVLSVSSSTHGYSAYAWRRYQNFLDQHRAPFVNREMCTNEISERKIGSETGVCKRVNTFIQANENQLKAVCVGGTQLNSNFFVSGQTFPLVTCRLQNGEQIYPNCQYQRGQLSTRYIVLACTEGLPVHYNRSSVQRTG